MSDSLYGGLRPTLTESERSLLSIALDELANEAEVVPELSLDEVLALRSKLLGPSEIAC